MKYIYKKKYNYKTDISKPSVILFYILTVIFFLIIIRLSLNYNNYYNQKINNNDKDITTKKYHDISEGMNLENKLIPRKELTTSKIKDNIGKSRKSNKRSTYTSDEELLGEKFRIDTIQEGGKRKIKYY
tara:strand:- start:2 stop:388 length:387 start_codon:yes stop_codon:yes gene_type:complete